MLTEPKMPNKISDAPRDKPQSERVEHANLERPGAAAHPRARRREWQYYTQSAGWRLH
jgi:hypothetical protein